MAVVVGHGVIPIKPDFGASFHRDIQREGAKATDGLTKQFGGAFKNIAKLAGGIFIGAQVVSVFKSAFAEAAEAQKIGKLTEQVIKSTGGAAKITAKQIGDLSTAISNKAGIDDEAIQSGANLIATFTRVRNEAGKGNDIFSQTVQVATDMSVALGQDMKSSSLQLGKALNDPIKGVTALTRAGVSFTQQQKDQIKALQESGDLLGAQKLILEEVGVQFGGAAAAAASPVEKLKVVWGNLLEDLGTRALPIIEQFAGWLGEKLPGALDTASRWFTNLRDAVTPVFRFIVDEAIPRVSEVVGSFLDGLQGKGGEGSFLTDLGEAARGAARVFVEDVLPVLKAVWGFIKDNLKPILITLGVIIAGPVGLIVGGLIFMYQKFSWFRTGVEIFMAIVKEVVTRYIDIVIIYFGLLLVPIKLAAKVFMEILWPAIQAAFRFIADVVMWAWENVLKPIFGFISALITNVLIPTFNFLKSVIVDFVFPLVMAIIREAWDVLQPIFNKIWEIITGVVVPAFQAIWDVVSSVWGFIRPVFEEIIKFIQEKLTPVWQGIAWAVSAAFDAIPGLIQGALRLVGGIVAGFLDGVGSIADAIGLDDIAKVLRSGATSARGWGQGGGSNNTGQGTGNIAVQGGQRRAMGGEIYGPKHPVDTVPIWATGGEFMHQRSAVDYYGLPFMKAINERRFAKGGLIPDIDLPGFADGVVDKARDVGTSALERVWPKMGTGSTLFSASSPSGFPAAGANYLRDAVIQLIRGKEQAMGSQSGGGFSRAGGGGPAGQYTAGMQRARADILNLFGPMSVGGYANRNIAGTNQRSMHALHRAWDFMTGKNVSRGNSVSGHLIRNASSYGLKGLIWNAQKNFGSGWAPYRHPGGGTNDTLMHRDHVHAEFFNKGGQVPYGLYDQGGFLPPGLSIAENRTGSPERVGGAGINIGEVHLNSREDVDEFWRRAEFAAMAGHL